MTALNARMGHVLSANWAETTVQAIRVRTADLKTFPVVSCCGFCGHLSTTKSPQPCISNTVLVTTELLQLQDNLKHSKKTEYPFT